MNPPKIAALLRAAGTEPLHCYAEGSCVVVVWPTLAPRMAMLAKAERALCRAGYNVTLQPGGSLFVSSPRPRPMSTKGTDMPVNNLDLGLAACRALMRDLDGKPVMLEVYNPRSPGRPDREHTSAVRPLQSAFGSMLAVMLPTLDFVSVYANLRYLGFGLYDSPVLSPEADEPFQKVIFVRYPDDPSAITGPEYGAELRAAAERALAAVEQATEAAR